VVNKEAFSPPLPLTLSLFFKFLPTFISTVNVIRLFPVYRLKTRDFLSHPDGKCHAALIAIQSHKKLDFMLVPLLLCAERTAHTFPDGTF